MQDGLDEELQQMDEREQDAPTLVEAVHLDDPLSALELQPLSVVEKGTTIKQAVELMKKNEVGCVLVTENGKLVGILTERDLIRRVMGHGLDHSVETTGSHMTRNPEYLRLEDSVAHALNHMYDRG